MFAPAPRRRSGITLTEILISILIMGVGMVSLATLFPLGLLRMRDANRMTRSALLAESAMNEIGSRNLLSQQSFLNPQFNPFSYSSSTYYNPWLQDTPAVGGVPVALASGFGLPVAYDPLWRASVPNSNYASSPNFNGVGYYLPTASAGLTGDASEARFGSGMGYIDTSAGTPSAYGLQRVTNFNPLRTPPGSTTLGLPAIYPNFSSYGTPNSTIAGIFVSPEDVVFQNKVDATGVQSQNVSTVVPDMSFTGGVATTNDWRYTWMFTGHQADAAGTVFEGQIVVFENRPFSIDPVTPPYTTPSTPWYQPTGETVVEAVFGYSPNAPFGYGQGADKIILLRWPIAMPDPDVKVGSWIADVTYERNFTTSTTRFGTPTAAVPTVYPGQRCYWYQIVKRSTPDNELNPVSGNQQGGLGQKNFRAMTVWISSTLNAKTQVTNGTGLPVYKNAALVCPYVVNVFPRTIYTR